MDKTLFDNKAELRELNFVALGRREFIAYTTSMWTAAVEAEKAAGMAKLPTLSAIEVNFKKPQPGQPLEMIWAPARGLITAKIRQCRLKSSQCSGRQTNPKVTQGTKALMMMNPTSPKERIEGVGSSGIQVQ